VAIGQKFSIGFDLTGSWFVMTDERMPSDKRLRLLVLRAQSGDRMAIDRLLSEHQHDLFGFLTNMLHNHADAEDALQVTLLQVVRKLKWLKNPASFRPWLYQIASRTAWRNMKTQGKHNQLNASAQLEQLAAAPQELPPEEDHLIQQIPQWLERLSMKGREAVILHYLKGFTTEQVAEILDIPLGTAKSRISYSLTCIRKWIEPLKETT